MNMIEIFAGIAVAIGDLLALMSFVGSAITLLLALVGAPSSSRFSTWSIGGLVFGTVCLISLALTNSTIERIGIFQMSPATMGITLFGSFLLLVARMILPSLISRAR